MRQQLRRDDADDRDRPDPTRAGQQRPAGDEHREQRRRDETAAQVVENLPPADQRQAVLRLSPRRDGTNGNSQNRICQSPRIQRC